MVGNVEEDIALALKQLAAAHRAILRNVLKRPQRRSVAEVLSSMPNVGEDADFNLTHYLIWRTTKQVAHQFIGKGITSLHVLGKDIRSNLIQTGL